MSSAFVGLGLRVVLRVVLRVCGAQGVNSCSVDFWSVCRAGSLSRDNGLFLNNLVSGGPSPRCGWAGSLAACGGGGAGGLSLLAGGILRGLRNLPSIRASIFCTVEPWCCVAVLRVGRGWGLVGVWGLDTGGCVWPIVAYLLRSGCM